MINYLSRAITMFALLLAFTILGMAQDKARDNTDSGGSVTSTVLKTAGKVPVIIVGSAAKAGWAVTKFDATRVAKPVAKTLIVKGAPKAAQLMLKTTGSGVKRALPMVVKLSLL